MRIPLATDFSSRDGSTSKDAILKNCFVETDGQQSVVIKRPALSSNLVDVTGTSQGGIANNSLVYVINGDTLRSYDSAFTLIETIAL